jgi:hypothetical protein
VDLLQNLRAGIRLAFFQRVGAQDFRATQDQLFLLIVLNTFLAVACEYLAALPPREFHADAAGLHAAWLFLTLLLAYLAAREAERPERFLPLAVALLSPLFLGWLVFVGVKLAARTWPFLGLLAGDGALLACFVLWLGWLGTRALRVVCALELPRAAALALAYLAALSFGFHHLSEERFWRSEAAFAKAEAGPQLNVEETFYAQHDLLERVALDVLPERAGVTDLYFVGFAADATQDVFMREVRYARQLFDRRFDTAGRSVALINNDETVDGTPLASASNLAAAVDSVGAAMNPAEDVLFLFLTGHGSREHELAVRFPPLPLNRFGATELATMLDDAGIRWRVIVVSACYSGGFIEGLRNDTTLVLTAAATDRKSFGCSNEADFTYFGRAFFAEQLAESEISFVTAFEQARERIHELEVSEGKKPSLPQIASTPSILAKLEALESRLLRDQRLAQANSP